jgi:PKD repeat protein
VFSSPADASHVVTCRADLPVHPGEPMTWRAIVTGGSGSFAFSWTGEDGLTGNSQAVTMTYTDVGFKEARVTVTDTAQGDTVAADCGMHVIPVSFSEP